MTEQEIDRAELKDPDEDYADYQDDEEDYPCSLMYNPGTEECDWCQHRVCMA